MMKKKKITPDIFSVPAAICPLIQRKYGTAELSLYEPIKLLTGSLVVIRQPISTHLFINIVSWPITKKKKTNFGFYACDPCKKCIMPFFPKMMSREGGHDRLALGSSVIITLLERTAATAYLWKAARLNKLLQNTCGKRHIFAFFINVCEWVCDVIVLPLFLESNTIRRTIILHGLGLSTEALIIEILPR